MITSLFAAAVELSSVVAVTAATLLVALILRNPHLPRWLDNEAVAYGAGLLLTAAAFFTVANAAASLTAAKVHYGVATIVIAGVLAGSAYLFWKVFDIGDRLARAEAGQSPFARRQTAPAAPAAPALEAAAAAG